jgi:hypothetical protein
MKIEIKNNFVNQKSFNNRMQRFQSEKKKFVRKIELFEKVRESQENFRKVYFNIYFLQN